MVEVVILDGGMGTTLTENGHAEIDQDPLWSAKLLLTKPSAIAKVHQDFLNSGTRIIGANTYQIPPGHESSETMVKTAFEIIQSLDFLRSDSAVSASIGPYGAILHDGSEYSGNYVDIENNLVKIEKYFVDKVNLITAYQPDIYAFETVPSLKEVEIIHEVMKSRSLDYYVSVQAKEDEKGGLVMGHGESLSQFIDCCMKFKNLNENKVSNCFALGLNCIHSKSVPSKFIKQYLEYLSENPDLHKILSVVLYPNNNMIWCGETHTWTKETENDLSWATDVISVIKESDVYKSGRLSANGNIFKLYLGGCCGYSPDLLRRLKISLPEEF